MKCTILRWLLGIWLVETVAARHIRNGEEVADGNVGTGRNGRDQYHRQPFYNSPPHFSYNSFMSAVRARRPPQVPGRRNLVEQDASNDHQQQYNNHYSNYFTNDRNHRQNQPNLNLYSALRLHGALEARANAEPGSNTLVPTTHHTNFYHPLEGQQDFSRKPADRQWRRDNGNVDGESFENNEDMARFSLYNSYFDNEHSIKALNSMKCVTPTGSPGFCSTFRGCVPSFFTADGQLEAPALAELISTSIGYCTTNVSHHYIREQREQQFSREERRFNSVANRIICCPGMAPLKDPNLDPDKIFMDYLENQKLKTSTTVAPEVSEPENVADGASNDSIRESEMGVGDGSQSQQTDQESSSPSVPEEGIVNDGESSSQDGSQSSSDAQQSSPVPVETNPEGTPVSEEPMPHKPESMEPSSEVPTTIQPVEQAQPEEEPVATPEQSSPSMEDKPAMMDPVEPSSEGSMMSKPEQSISSSPVPPVENIEADGDDESSQSPTQNDEGDMTTFPASSTSSPSTPPQPSPENNYEPKPVHPPAGGETVVGTRPIIIVTNNPNPMPGIMMPGLMMPSHDVPVFPHFPSDFPPMGSAENQVPPVDDSSLEMQSDSPSSEIPSGSPSSQSPSSSTQSNIETEATTSNAMLPGAPGQHATESDSSISMTTNEPQQEEGVGTSGGATTQGSSMTSGGDMQHQQDESDMPIITTIQPEQQQPVVQGATSGDSTTTAPLMDDEEGDNDALTILPIQESASEKSGSTTPIPAESFMTTSKSQPADAIAGGDVQSQQTGGAGVAPAAGANDITTISSAPVSPQDAEVTTEQPKSAVHSQEAVETTTLAATTEAPNDDESDESDESREDDLQKTTTLNPEEQNADLNRIPTTTFAPQSDDGQDDEIPQGTTVSPADESMKPLMPQSDYDHSTASPPNGESLVTDSPQKVVLNPGSESIVKESDDSIALPAPSDSAPVPVQDQPQQPEGHISETVPPFPVSSPATPGETEQQQLFPGSEQQQPSADQPEGSVTSSPVEPQQPYPGSESGQQWPVSDAESSTASASTSSDDQQQQVGSGSEPSIPDSESGSASESSQAANVGESTGIPTTGAPIPMEQDGSAGGTQSQIGGESTTDHSGLPSADEGASSGSESVPGSGNESVGSTSEPSPVSGSDTVPVHGSESPSQGSGSIVPGTESSVSGSGASDAGSTQSSVSGGADSNNEGGEPIVSDPAASESEDESTHGINSASQTSSSTPAEHVTESASSSSPDDIPSHDDSPSQSEDSNSADNELPISSSTAASTGGGTTEAEAVSQDAIPSVSSDDAEDASPMPGSSEQADGSVSPDHVQDPQPIISTTETSQDVSSPIAEISNNSSVSPYPGMTLSTSTSTAAPSSIEQDDLNRFQILKACKFQSYFRSNLEDDMDYSYRHYPWLATIVGGTRPFSSGTLITDRHILTAAHFLANITVSDLFNMRIHVGYRTSFTGNTEGPYAVRKVRKVIRHKGFSFEKLYNDIAVLVLDRPVRFSEDIFPVCLSSSRNSYEDGSTSALETGWVEDPRTYTISQHHNYVDPHIQKYFSFGYKNITWRLQEASQRVRTNQECQENYGFLEKNSIMVTDSMVCAGSGDTRSCAFRGNSGSPLFLRNEDSKMTEQIAVASWSIGCGNFPFVFTRVQSFLPWLDRVVYNS